jgi:4-amino-4-deoxy-L-arabinose transferase-like glycosyltransferase
MTAAVPRLYEDYVEVSAPGQQTKLLLGGVLLLATFLRFVRLDHHSFWLDEAASFDFASRPLAAIFSLSDHHPPLYYLSLHYWIAGFGDSEESMRALSAVLGVLAVALVFTLGEQLFGPRAGLLAALVAALSPFWVWYAQEARMYAMVVFFALLSANCLVRAIRSSKPGWWLGYVAATALLLYADHAGLWWFLATNVYFAVRLWRSRSDVRGWASSRDVQLWAAANLAVVILFVPWLVRFWDQFAGVSLGSEGTGVPTNTTGGDGFRYLVYVIHSFNSYVFNFTPSLENTAYGGVSVLIALGLLILALRATGKDGATRDLVWAWFIVPLAASFLISQWTSIFVLRNLIVASIAFYLLIGVAAARMNHPRLVVAVLLPLVVLNAVSLGRNFFIEDKEEWRNLVRLVDDQASPGDLVYIVPAYTDVAYNYYSRRPDLPVMGYAGGDGEAEGLTSLTDGFDTVWLIVGAWHARFVDKKGEVKAWFDANASLREEREGGGIRLYRYELGQGPP